MKKAKLKKESAPQKTPVKRDHKKELIDLIKSEKVELIGLDFLKKEIEKNE